MRNAARLVRYGKKEILKTLNERMQEAAERLEFETAALLRDQIAAITKLSAGQKVVVDPDVEMDVVALAGTPSSVCAAVLRFREGRLTDKREFLFQKITRRLMKAVVPVRPNRSEPREKKHNSAKYPQNRKHI